MTLLTEITIRCPEWQRCEYTKCNHRGLHKPDINCFTKSPGSIRPAECPDCKVIEK